MRSVEVVEICLIERLVIEQFPGWSGGKARLDMLGAVHWGWLDGGARP